MNYEKNSKKVSKLAKKIAEELFESGLSKVKIDSVQDVYAGDKTYTVKLIIKEK